MSAADAQVVFRQFRIPAFSVAQWLDEMVDKGVYSDLALERAA